MTPPWSSTLQPGELRGESLRQSLRVITIAWIFGAVWMTATSGAPLTLFAQELGASKFQFGLLAAMPFIASMLSLPASLLTDRTGQRKLIFLIGLYVQRALWFVIAVVPPLMVHFKLASQGVIVWTFLALIFLMHAGQAVGGPAWVSWMADVVPERSRGTYFGRRRQWGIISSVPAALLVGWMLDHYIRETDGFNTLIWCGVVFVVAAVFGLADIALFHRVPDIHRDPQPRVGLSEIFKQPLRDIPFLWFCGYVATLVFAVSFMGQFLTLYLIERMRISNTEIQLMLLVAPLAAQLLLFRLWGRVCDRFGKKPVLAIASLGLVPVGLGWVFLDIGPTWMGYFLSAAGAALWAGVEIANFNLVLELGGSSEKDEHGRLRGGSNFIAVNAVFINIAGCAGGVASGIIAELLRDWQWDASHLYLGRITFYEVLFMISAALRLLAVVVFLPRIHEPDARPTQEAIRFMTANFYNNLFNLVMQPMRMVKAMKENGNGQSK